MDAANLIGIIELLLIAVAVAVGVKFIRLPYTVALVIVGLLVGFADFFQAFHLSKDVILLVFLPPLLFEGTLNMDLSRLKRSGWLVGALAVVGTLVSAALVGGLAHLVLGLPLLPALLLGAIITPTDPVSVLAIFKECGVAKGLATIVEGESVFNDGIGVVLYLILIEFAVGHEMTAADAVGKFFWEAAGGAGIGLICGYLAYLVLARLDDHLIEVLISVILAFGAYLAAERVHASGVVAVVCAGLIVGNFGTILAMSPRTRLSLDHFWEVVAFAANGLLFLLIGIDLDSAALLRAFGQVAALFALTVLVRSLAVYAITTVADAARRPRVPWAWRHVVNWGGVRGSIPIALVLGLPATLAIRSELTTLVFGVVLLSLVLQGLTIKPLLKRLGLIGADETEAEYEEALAARIAATAAAAELRKMHQAGEVSETIFDEEGRRLADENHALSERLHALRDRHPGLQEAAAERIRDRLGYARLTALRDAFFRGLIGEETVSRLGREIEAEIEGDSERHKSKAD